MKQKILLVLAFFLIFSSLTSRAQDAMTYYERIQSIRDKSSDLWQKKKPTELDLQKSIEMTREAIRLLDSLPVTQLAN